MTQQIYQLPTTQELLADAREIFDVDQLRLWLDTPNEYLGGQTPDQSIESGDRGRELVRNLLEAIKLGLPA